MKRVLLLSALFSTTVFAQSTEDRIKQLEDQIKALQEEVQKLKEDQKKSEETKQETEVLKEEIRKLRLEIAIPQLEIKSYSGLGPAASKALLNPKGVSIGGYGEIHFLHNSDKKPKNSVDAKRLVLYFGYAFNEKLKFNSEIEWEHAFVEGKEESGETAVEFAFIDYNFNEKFGIRGGLLLVPVGIINEYHEPPTFPSVDRPYLERVIIPTTWRELGFGAYGRLGALEYRAYITNGLKPNEEAGEKVEKGELLQGFKQKGFKASADQIAFTGRLDYSLPLNAKVGASTFTGGIQDEEGNRLGSISLFSPHLWWQYEGWDVRFVGAYGSVSDAQKVSKAISTNPACTLLGDTSQCTTFPKRFYGFYTQVAYDILRFFKVSDQQLYLFGIYENYNTHASVPQGFEKPQGSKVQVFNFGLSYKPHPLVALKADYVRYAPKDAKKQNIYRLALGWMF
ncbi:MAG: FlxA-like family protein [Hydrogenobacter sp.]|uniref:FlxA-like family protein n=1 Tax=Hydrogenobacter thermophilus TaxID=940 RepID=UPI0030F94B34